MKIAIVAALALSTAGIAFAGGMEDSEKTDKVQVRADEAAKDVATKCGGDFKAKVDRPTFTGDAFSVAAGYCSQAVGGVAEVCDALPAHKKEIIAAVKSVTCHYDASLTENHGVKVVKTGTNVDVSFNSKSANVIQSVRDYLKKNL
jgi:hypothetical protein